VKCRSDMPTKPRPAHAIIRPRHPILVKWNDASRGPNEWTILDPDYKPPSITGCYSAGWLVHDGRDSITLAGHVGVTGDQQFVGELTIPRSAIVWVKRLKVAA
jgi:hypothetical protein